MCSARLYKSNHSRGKFMVLFLFWSNDFLFPRVLYARATQCIEHLVTELARSLLFVSQFHSDVSDIISKSLTCIRNALVLLLSLSPSNWVKSILDAPQIASMAVSMTSLLGRLIPWVEVSLKMMSLWSYAFEMIADGSLGLECRLSKEFPRF